LTNDSDRELDDDVAAAEAVDDTGESESVEEDEGSLNGFGSTSDTSTLDEEEGGEDDNEYYRNQAVSEANRKYHLGGSSRRDSGARNGKEYNNSSSSSASCNEMGSSFSSIAEEEKQPATTEKQNILNRVGPEISVGLEGHEWEVISYNPLKFIIAREDLGRVVHAYVRSREVKEEKTDETKTIKKLYIDKVLINAIPTEIVLEQSIKYHLPKSIQKLDLEM
jgi:hypothetical protein